MLPLNYFFKPSRQLRSTVNGGGLLVAGTNCSGFCLDRTGTTGIIKKVYSLAGFSVPFPPLTTEPDMPLRLAFVVVAALVHLQESSVAVPAKVLEEYVGTYKLGPLSLVVTVEDGRIMGEAAGIPKFSMPAPSETKFYIPPASV